MFSFQMKLTIELRAAHRNVQTETQCPILCARCLYLKEPMDIPEAGLSHRRRIRFPFESRLPEANY
jgi:hypothetical protein